MSNTITTEYREKYIPLDQVGTRNSAGQLIFNVADLLELPDIKAFMESYANDRVKERVGEIHSFIYECEEYDEPEFNRAVDIIATKVKEKFIEGIESK